MNQPHQTKRLTIFKASAGSGKTFRLVMEYISLLLGVGKHKREPNKYKQILVVTFTNKATAELRERILKELYKISTQGMGSVMLQEIISHQELPQEMESEIAGRYKRDAQFILAEILSDYNSFRVQTIDSFFQEVVRSFIYELGHGKAGADIELNKSEAIESALDVMLRELEPSNPILQWLEKLYQEALQNGEHYHIQREATRLASSLLYSDHEKVFNSQDYSPEIINSHKKALQDFARNIEDKINSEIQTIRNILGNDEELTLESNNRFLHQFFTKDAATLLKECGEGKYLFRKDIYEKVDKGKDFNIVSKIKSESIQVRLNSIKEEVYDSLLRFIALETDHAKDYVTAQILLKNIDLIPVISSIREALEEYQIENNILLIDEVNGLMREIIDGASEPFIYEKIGGRINHFMIDEFQDTSRLQWANFKPLLEESLNKEEEKEGSYLVGDVKQSIYRWRDADSSILNTKVEKAFPYHATATELQENWRSDKKIIEFNNLFFEDIYSSSVQQGALVSSSNVDVYKKNIIQNPGNVERQSGDGYVNIDFLESQKNSDDTDAQVSKRLKEIIDEVLADDYSLGDITILVRDSKSEQKVCGFLKDYSSDTLSSGGVNQYGFISNEALLINSSLLIQVIATAIQYAIHKGAYSTDLKLEVMAKRLKPAVSNSELNHIKELTNQNLSLIDFVNQVAQLFKPIATEDQIYLNSFLDLVISFTDNHPITYLQFYQWWEEIKNKQCVDMGSAELNSIKVMTIHKAKGLEFPVVIIPYADWEINKSGGFSEGVTICTKDDLKGFSLPSNELLDHYLISASPTKAGRYSKLSELYSRIAEENLMDNLNLLYVAFTRAVHRLYLICPTQEENSVSAIIAQRLGGSKGIQVPYGVKCKKAETAKSSITNRELQLPNIESSILNAHLEVREERYSDENTDKGILLHEMMSRAREVADIEKAISRSFRQFDLTEEEYNQYLSHAANSLQSNSSIKDWFLSTAEKKKESPELQERVILTEPTLYCTQSRREIRPDRVLLDQYPDHKEATIIDYKFGDKANIHHKQVQEYMDYFRKCGYTTRGFLWYSLDEVIEVKQP